jgi:hypothetical protein
MKSSENAVKLLEALNVYVEPNTVFNKKEIFAAADNAGISHKQVWPLLNKENRVSRGNYTFSALVHAFPMNKTQESNNQKSIESIVSEHRFIPETDESFVPWGEYSSIQQIIKSGAFYPTYVFGLSGNGKTMMIEQAAAKLKREYIRVQITPETDEDDLIGGFRLVNGETVFAKGPVLKAMENGAILLLDEIDRGTNKIMCLQGILEGRPFLVKKTGDIVRPTKGFNIFATANTQGRGSIDGRFNAASILDEAFLERFTVAIEQDYPSESIERRILINHMEQFEMEKDEELANKLVKWSSIIRKTYLEEGIDDLISTRRLCHIVQTYAIFNDELKAIKMCITRFEAETRDAFLDLYEKLNTMENS